MFNKTQSLLSTQPRKNATITHTCILQGKHRVRIPPPPRLLPQHLMFRLLLCLAPTTATETLNPTIMRSTQVWVAVPEPPKFPQSAFSFVWPDYIFTWQEGKEASPKVTAVLSMKLEYMCEDSGVVLMISRYVVFNVTKWSIKAHTVIIGSLLFSLKLCPSKYHYPHKCIAVCLLYLCLFGKSWRACLNAYIE